MRWRTRSARNDEEARGVQRSMESKFELLVCSLHFTLLSAAYDVDSEPVSHCALSRAGRSGARPSGVEKAKCGRVALSCRDCPLLWLLLHRRHHGAAHALFVPGSCRRLLFDRGLASHCFDVAIVSVFTINALLHSFARCVVLICQ